MKEKDWKSMTLETCTHSSSLPQPITSCRKIFAWLQLPAISSRRIRLSWRIAGFEFDRTWRVANASQSINIKNNCKWLSYVPDLSHFFCKKSLQTALGEHLVYEAILGSSNFLGNATSTLQSRQFAQFAEFADCESRPCRPFAKLGDLGTFLNLVCSPKCSRALHGCFYAATWVWVKPRAP